MFGDELERVGWGTGRSKANKLMIEAVAQRLFDLDLVGAVFEAEKIAEDLLAEAFAAA